jgi:murein DD-endopeptidase MepM/ murein hydrolase activator NlpD
MRARQARQRDGVWRRRTQIVLALALLAGLGFLAWAKLEWRRPTATLASPAEALGTGAVVEVRLADPQTGLRWSRVELESAAGRVVLAREDYPAVSWRGSAVRETALAVPLRPRERGIPEGPATLRVYADDHSWLRWFRRERPLLERTVTIDTTPPTLEVLTQQHYINLGGVDFLLYRASADTVRSGVEVGPYFFPGTAGLFADATISAAFFAVPQDLDAKAIPRAVAEDAAGNRREVTFHAAVKPRRFAEKRLEIGDDFLQRKVPEILAASGLPDEPDLLRGYLYINRTLRESSEARIREATRTSAPAPLWEGTFLRQPNSAPLAGFGDRRSYLHRGETIDVQTHLGFDLASLRQAPVPAANAGRVVLAGPLGIYGEAVILDHGLGIFSLYGHLSAIMVGVGEEVHRGDLIGRTGETGLAGGDHLHFSVMLWGVHVDPVEWWDGKWLRDRVLAKLEAYPRAESVAARDGGATER